VAAISILLVDMGQLQTNKMHRVHCRLQPRKFIEN